ncbi:MAG: hypothetical protein AWM53_01703 [Candidatus Dichloromethanomonas elyunquensis]|nr:MAG: hypothetical protein AWM53_01703 [Candidatus Dichloromethanomonas elyunquensis]
MAVKGRLFGYNKKEVARYLQELSDLQETNFEKLKMELQTLQNENNLLKKDIEKLTSTCHSSLSLELLELSLERMDFLFEYMKRYQDEDFCNSFDNEYLIREQLRDNISHIESEIQETKENIKKELDYINKIIKTSNLSLVTTTTATSIPRQGTAAKESSKIENEDTNIIIMNNPITADGTLVHDQRNRIKENPIRSKNITDEEKAVLIPEQTSFWMKTDSFSPRKGTDTKLKEPKEIRENQSKELHSLQNIEELSIRADKEIAATFGEPVEETKVEKHNAAQDDLLAEIDLIRYKYILGKIAGEDLKDNSGAMIIKKGETITSEIVERAQRGNKLSDLIINMVVQGMDE